MLSGEKRRCPEQIYAYGAAIQHQVKPEYNRVSLMCDSLIRMLQNWPETPLCQTSVKLAKLCQGVFAR